MQKALSDYLDTVCAPIRNKALRQQVREELSVHLRERYADLQQGGMGDGEAARMAVEKFGDGEALGRRIVRANRSEIKWATAVAGAALFFFMILAIVAMAGMNLMDYMDMFGLCGVVGCSAGLALLATARNFSWEKFWHNVRATSIICGLLVGVLGLVNSLYGVPVASGEFQLHVAVSLLGPMYGMMLFGIAYGLERLCQPSEDAAWRELISG